NNFANQFLDLYLHTARRKRRISSAGSEHLPYKQRVTGSNPVFSTKIKRRLSSAGSEHLPYKQRVTGSNPVASTKRRCLKRHLLLFYSFCDFITVFIFEF